MNPQPSEYVGNVFALLFLGLITFYAIKSYKSGYSIDISNIDLVNIGYVERDPDKEPNVITVVKNNIESQQLYLDCVEALHALGFKKSEAKKKTKAIFLQMDPPPSSIQEFLSIALKS